MNCGDATSYFRGISAKLSAMQLTEDGNTLRWKEKKKDEEEPQQPLLQPPLKQTSISSFSLQPQLQTQQTLFTVVSAVEARAVITTGGVCGNNDNNNNDNNIGNSADGNSAGSSISGGNKGDKFNNNNNNNNICIDSSCTVGKGSFALEGEKIRSMLLTQVQQSSALLKRKSSQMLTGPSCIYTGSEYCSDFFSVFNGNYGGSVDKNNENNCGGTSQKNDSANDIRERPKIELAAVIARRRQIEMIPKNVSPINAKNYASLLPQKSPKNHGKKTLILDVDETLVHSSLLCRPNFHNTVLDINIDKSTTKVYVAFRPFLRQFLNEIAPLFEVVIFTASVSIYCNLLMNTLDPDGILGSLRLYREHCSTLNGAYVKDLSLLGRDLAQVAILDNSPVAYLFQRRNAIPIPSWFEDPTDRELLNLLPMLKKLAQASEVYDVLDNYNAIIQLQQEQFGLEHRNT